MHISLGFWEWGYPKRRDAHITVILPFLSPVSSRFPVFISYTLKVTMDRDRAEIKCSNKNLKINWFVKRCNIGLVW